VALLAGMELGIEVPRATQAEDALEEGGILREEDEAGAIGGEGGGKTEGRKGGRTEGGAVAGIAGLPAAGRTRSRRRVLSGSREPSRKREPFVPFVPSW
jgi:hypothetical protein